MRLWHYKLIPYLPNKQLVSQWRELNIIFKKQIKFSLINYVYEYPKHDLLAYSILVTSEMIKRNYRINSTKNFDKYFEYTKIIDIENREKFKPFKNHHNNRYLKQCFYNLQEKYDRGQKDFTQEQYIKLKEFIKNEIH